ncbi:oligosaccharide flippase family protein [bacterium]|nr:oligosaccharide flippase family protein [bacterium]
MTTRDQTGNIPDSAEDHTNLANKAGIMVVSRAMAILVQLATMMTLTRILTKDDFGLLSFLLLAYSSVLTISQLGLPESIFYFFEKMPAYSRKAVALVVARILFFLGLGGSTLLLVLTFVAPLWGYEVEGMFLPLVFLILLELPTTPLPNILIAIDRAKTAAWLNIVFSVLQFLAVIVPASLGAPLQALMFSLLGYGVIRFILSNALFFVNVKGELSPRGKGLTGELLRYSVPLGLAQILWGLNRQIDKYVVAALFPAAVLAEYTIGAWEIPIIPGIAYSVASVMMPQYVSSYLKGEKSELLALWFKAIHKVSIIVLPLTVLFLIAAEEFITLFFSANYLAAAVPFRIYTIILLQRVAAYSSMHRALGNTKIISYAAIYLLVINLGLSVPFALWLGIAGPPTATLVANVFSWWYSMKKMQTALVVRWRDVFPFGFYGKTLVTSALAAVPIVLFKFSVDTPVPMKLATMVVGYLLAYAFFSSISGVVKREDWSYLVRGLRLKSN